MRQGFEDDDRRIRGIAGLTRATCARRKTRCWINRRIDESDLREKKDKMLEKMTHFPARDPPSSPDPNETSFAVIEA